jgi:cysteinyl-tRNA synthetase
LQSGAREQVIAQDALAHLKKSPVDFALWKSADEDELGWPSPWGRGRPGWHLECSTMVQHILGETIDIHSGGEDLVFPHHENEIAQSEALQEKPLAKYWMHNGFIQVSAEKMAKSLGNFKTIQDLLQTYSSDTIRIFVLQTHYRNPIDFTPESLAAVKTGLNRLVRARVAGLATVQTPGVPAANGNGSKDAGGANGNGKVEATAGDAASGDAASGDAATASAPSENAQNIARKFSDDFTQAMNNDFNTAVAISLLFQLSDQILALKPTEQDDKTYLASFLTEYAGILGLTLADTRKSVDTTTGGKLVDLLLDLRKEAKSKKDFATADAIRKQLIEIGINVMDTATGATWESDN